MKRAAKYRQVVDDGKILKEYERVARQYEAAYQTTGNEYLKIKAYIEQRSTQKLKNKGESPISAPL